MNPRPYSPTPGTVRKAAALAVMLLALLLGTAVPASAHAALIRTDPADGSVVQTAPQRVVLTFSEGVLLSNDSLRVLDPHGTNVATGTPGHAAGADSGSTATIALRPGLGKGTYTVAWRAVSQDSHPVAGAFTFSVGAASRTTVDLSGVAAAGGGAAAALYGIGRYLAYAGFALLVGGSVFLAVCWPRGALLRPMQRLASAGWVTLVVATIALLVLRGPYVNGKGLGQAFDLEVMRAQLETRPGAALLSRLLLLAAAAVFLAVLFGSYAKREDPAERADLAWGLGIGGSVVAVGIAATWAMAEHASVGIQRTVAMPLDVVHLVSMAVWLGGLVTLLTALWAPSMAGRPVPAFAVRRFSVLAMTAITLLVGTGIYQAWRQLGTWRAFTDTSYGRLLLIKIGLVAVVVCLAWFSRRWTAALGSAAGRGAAQAARPGEAQVRVATSGGSKAGAAKRARDGDGKAVAAADDAAGAGTATATAATAVQDAQERPAAAAGARPGAGPDPVGGAADGPARRPADGAADGAGTAAGSRAGRRAGTAPDPARPADADAVPAPAGGRSASPARAEQLRRQQAARSAATARKVRDADPARSSLRRSVLAEAAVAAVLLAVTTMLSGSQPGRAAEEQKALPDAPAASSSTAADTGVPPQLALDIPYDTGGPKGKGTAGFTLAPGRAATPNEIHLLLTDPGNRPVDVPEVRVAFTLPARHIGPIPVTLHRIDVGHWTATGVQLPLPGAWQLSVTVRTSDIDEVTEFRNVKVTS